MISKEKVYITRSGKPVKIFSILPDRRYPVKGGIINPDGTISIHAWTIEGKFFWLSWLWGKNEKDLFPATKHRFYTDLDLFKPKSILDGNGQVCLDLCKICRAAESELSIYNSCESFFKRNKEEV